MELQLYSEPKLPNTESHEHRNKQKNRSSHTTSVQRSVFFGNCQPKHAN